MRFLTRILDKITGSSSSSELDAPGLEPVLTEVRDKAVVSAAIKLVLTAATALGLVSASDAPVLLEVSVGVVGAGVTVVDYSLALRAAWRARAKVRPMVPGLGSEGLTSTGILRAVGPLLEQARELEGAVRAAAPVTVSTTVAGVTTPVAVSSTVPGLPAQR